MSFSLFLKIQYKNALKLMLEKSITKYIQILSCVKIHKKKISIQVYSIHMN